ncbi:MFS transporter [Tanticharoenia sakaeratensis]|nr:MFS transporter [Tanticharoenia sakaeratensis]GBQ18772.1 arabinose efflux permease family protein [Tanticharoenia sakaeratensis NBRC 103193]
MNAVYDRLGVAALMLAVLLAVLDYSVVNVALPALSQALKATSAASIWVVNAYQIASCTMLLPAGALAQRWGARRICLTGLGVLIAGSVGCAAARDITMLAAARIVQGLGGAAILSVSADLFRRLYPPAAIGRALALSSMTASIAVAIGPSVAAVVLHVMSWRGLFLFNIPLGLVAFGLGWRFLPRASGLASARLDLRAVILNALAFGGVLLGGDWLAHGGNRAGGLCLLAAGCAALAAFVTVERRREHPMLPLDLLGRPAFSIAALTCAMGYLAANFFMVSIPFALTRDAGRSVEEGGLLLTGWPVGIVLIAQVAGRLSDRLSASVVSSCGLGIVGAAYSMTAFIRPESSDFSILARFLLAGIGFGLFVSPNNRALMLAAPHARSAGASALLSLARLLGQTCGAMATAFVFARVAQDRTTVCLLAGAGTAWVAAVLSAGRAWLPAAALPIGRS